MRALVTGAAGFIGSHLAGRLAEEGHAVLAVDCFTSAYDPQRKRENVDALPAGCSFVAADLRTADLHELLTGINVVFHQAGQPGVRNSWRSGFRAYVEHNVMATQRLLEAARDRGVVRFVFASSSSVYGNALRYPTSETDAPAPHSPYGVTKLAAEQLCAVYALNWGVPTVALRYFTVYGPRQRPDMAIHRLIEASLSGRRFPLFGDGRQVRDFTYVGDVVKANLLAAVTEMPPGTVVNIGGGSAVALRDVMAVLEHMLGRHLEVERHGVQAGDVQRTGARIDRAIDVLGWAPEVGLREGLARQVAWHRGRRGGH